MLVSLKDDMVVKALIDPAALSADNTPAAAQIDEGKDCTVLLFIGAGGITFTADNKIEFKLTHSTDGSTYSAVTEADMKGCTVGDGGVIFSLTAAHASASTEKFAYVGAGKYLKLLADFSGTHGTGTPIAAFAFQTRLYKQPA